MTRSRVPPAPMPLGDPARALIGRTIAERYVVRSIVGRGGMGVVYAAEDLASRSWVALKVLPRMMRDPDSVQRFEREIHAMQSLQHPAVVAMQDSGWLSTSEPWLVMELLDGATLHDRIDRGPVPAGELAALLAPIADAIDALHALAMVHRDLKPGNVLFADGAQTRAKLADFGLALLLESGLPRLTDPGVILGTPAYLPPEAATMRHWSSPASDRYALGVLIFEALSGELPFAGSTVDVLMAKRGGPAPSMSARSECQLSSAVEAVVAHALAMRPEARPPTATAIVSALADAATR